MPFQRRSALYLVALLTVFCSGGAARAPEGEAPSQAPKKLALLVGIDDYKDPRVSDLSGCANDVENMKSILTTKFEFPEANVLVLKNDKATRKGILDAFQTHLTAKANAGDIVVFHYSGHGSQMKDTSGDEADGLDETIVPHDSREGTVFDINDDELNGLLDQLARKTENVTFILDSCHSGTGARAAGLPRLAPPDTRTPPDPGPFAMGARGVDDKSDVRPSDSKYVLISGCRSKELSYEYRAEGKSNGALTYFLAQELRAAGASTTYRDVMDKVMGKVSAAYASQHPGLEGAKGDNYVFGDATSVAEPFILASPKPGGGAELKAGEVQGLTKGSLFDVYKPGTKKFSDPEGPLARVELAGVGPFTSDARTLSGGPIVDASRAVERKHQYTDRKLVVHYMGLERSGTLRAIKAELDKLKLIEAAPEPAGYHLLLREDTARKAVVTEGGDPGEISPPVSVSDADVVHHVVEQVMHWARWYNVLSIVNRAPAFGVKLTVQVVKEGTRGSPFKREDQVDIVLEEGDEFELAVENRAGRDLYLSVLDLEGNGAVARVFPTVAGAEEILAAGATWKRQLRTTLPPGSESIRDIIKVFATTHPVDLRVLDQGAVRGGETRSATNQDPLGQLLENALTGVTRGFTDVRSDSWVTAERVIEVRKKKSR